MKERKKAVFSVLKYVDSLPAEPQGIPGILEWVAYLPNPEIEQGSPALQVDSLPTELSGKPTLELTTGRNYSHGCTCRRVGVDLWKLLLKHVILSFP